MKWSVIIASALFFPLSAFAEVESNVQTEFDAMDANKDGYVSIIEAAGKLDLLRQWVNVDQNSDGQLEMSEFSAFEAAPAYVQDEDEDQPNIGAEPH